MRMALSMPADKPLTNEAFPFVPSWLTTENAAALANAPCVNGLTVDLACWYCEPTPKPKDDDEIAAAAAAAVSAARARAAAAAREEQGPEDS